MENDKVFLGREPIDRLLFRLALPTVVAQLVNMLYNIVDRMFLSGIQMSCQLLLTSIGNAPCSIIVAPVRKVVLLIPLIYIMPSLGIISNKAYAVYMADVIAVTVTRMNHLRTLLLSDISED